MNLKLEDQRESLVKLIEIRQPQGKGTNQVTVVFDGQSGMGNRTFSSSIRVLFSSGESADDKIKAIVENTGNPKNIIVVSDDRDIQYAIRASGAQSCSVKEFLGKLSKERKGQKQQRSESNKVIPKTLEHKINEELKDIWLKG